MVLDLLFLLTRFLSSLRPLQLVQGHRLDLANDASFLEAAMCPDPQRTTRVPAMRVYHVALVPRFLRVLTWPGTCVVAALLVAPILPGDNASKRVVATVGTLS